MELIIKLRSTKEETLRFFDLPESDLIKTYGEGKWSVRQILNHLADAETVLYERFRRIIGEQTEVLWGFDQDLWAVNLGYESFPLSLNKEIYSSVREAIIYLVDKFYHSHGHLQFVHSRTGLKTLKEEFDKVASHNQTHIDQINTALNR